MKKNCTTCVHQQSEFEYLYCNICRQIFSTGGEIYNKWESKEQNQTAKADAGKPKLTLVPPQIIRDIAVIREYGNKKYGDPENWKTVEKQRYQDAAYRHWLAYLEDNASVDEESGLPHLAHLACNISFLCEMENNHD